MKTGDETKREIARKCDWCGNALYVDQIEEMSNARGYGEYIMCEKCGNSNVISEVDLTREF